MEINIAYCVNCIYKYISLVSIASVLLTANSNDDYNFYIITDDITDEDKDKYNTLSNIHKCKFFFINANSENFNNLYTYIGPVAYYRLKMPSYVDKGKILYLDADTLCMTDIAKLYSYDIYDYLMAAVEDIIGEHWGKKLNFNYEIGEQYFNSGVLLMNLDKMRCFDFEKKVFSTAKDNKYWDQDLLNIVAKDNILSLPIKYNCMPFDRKSRIVENEFYVYYRKRMFEYDEAILNAYILHLSAKPWENLNSLFAEKWFCIKNVVDELLSYRLNKKL